MGSSFAALGCVEVPADPKNGDELTCPGCGFTATFVAARQLPGEWVS